MARKTTTPKPTPAPGELLTTNGNLVSLVKTELGVSVRVGKGSQPRITVTPEMFTAIGASLFGTKDGIARHLGIQASADAKSVAGWIEAVKTAEADRDAARKQEATWRENYHLAAQERADLRQRKDDSLQLLRERDQARADHGAADVALQDALTDLKSAGSKIDAWEATANRHLRDLRAANANLAEVAETRDAALAEAKSLHELRESDRLAFAAELHRARALGWLYAGVSLAVGIAALVASIKLGWLGGGR